MPRFIDDEAEHSGSEVEAGDVEDDPKNNDPTASDEEFITESDLEQAQLDENNERALRAQLDNERAIEEEEPEGGILQELESQRVQQRARDRNEREGSPSRHHHKHKHKRALSQPAAPPPPPPSQPQQIHIRHSHSASDVRVPIEEKKDDEPPDDSFDINLQLAPYRPDPIPDDIVHRFCEQEPEIGKWRDILNQLSITRREDEDFPRFYRRQVDVLQALYTPQPSSLKYNVVEAIDNLEKISRILYELCGGNVQVTNALEAVELSNRIVGSRLQVSVDHIHKPCELYKQYAAGLISANDKLQTHNPRLSEENKKRCADIHNRLLVFYHRIDYIQNMRMAMFGVFMTTSPKFSFLMAPSTGAFTTEDLDDLGKEYKFQHALILVMRRAKELNLRRVGAFLYEPFYLIGPNEQCIPTHYYKRRGSLEEFMGHVCDYYSGPDFKDVMQPNYISNVPKWIEIMNTSDLPILVRDRHVFSFKNGIFNALHDRNELTHSFIEYNSAANRRQSLISCNFIDQEVDPNWCKLPYWFFPNDASDERCVHDSDLERMDDMDWMYAIPTPCLDQIFLYQWPEDAEEQAKLKSAERVIDPMILRRFTYAMIGRLLYDVNELDRWQIMLLIIGEGQTGKSIICEKLMGKSVYQPTDVHQVSFNFCYVLIVNLHGLYNTFYLCASVKHRTA